MIESTVQSKTEGPVARAIEQQTSRVPSDVFLWAGLGLLGLSAMQTLNRRRGGQFMAQLAPTLLLLGLYNKLVKVAGSDKYDQPQGEFGPGQRAGVYGS